jgi:ubiquinone/menaquinone biosynthesis C-methylase UbiE
VFFVQADAFELPIRSEFFDCAYSIGVLHHTPYPEKAFGKMVDLVKDDGMIGLSLYDISLYHRPNRNTLRVATVDLLWALNHWRAEFFRVFTTRLPSSVMLFYCRTIVPVLHVLNKIPVLRYARYLLPCTCYSHLPMAYSMVDTMDTYKTRIVHQYRAKDVFQWYLALGLCEIVVMNSRAGWVSIVASKGSKRERLNLRRQLQQPNSPGKEGFLVRP